MKYDKFFALAKEKGIKECELYISETYSLSFSLFHSEIDDYQTNNGFAIVARGLVNGKMGSASCDAWNKTTPEFLVKEIIENAGVIQDEDPMFIFKGSEKYKKINSYNKELETISIDQKLKDLYDLEKFIKEGDQRIIEVAGVSFSESRNKVTLLNSHGLKLSQKINYFVIFGQAVAKQGEQVKSSYELSFGNDYSKYSAKELANKVVENVVSQLGGEACPSGKYKTVLSNNVVATLMSAYISSASAEEVQKQSSFLTGKLNTKVASAKVTIEDKPLAKTLFGRGFDDEGVATYNKAIIKKGVLNTYLYNLTTAAKDKVESTGNGFKAGGTMGVAPTYLCMKPGKKSLEELFEEVGNGVYITDVAGLHSGLDATSGNFSLQAQGFLIKDGKKDRSLDVITCGGNLLQLFADIKTVGNNAKLFPDSTSAPAVVVKKLAIGGK